MTDDLYVAHQKAEEAQNAILLFDEADAMCGERVAVRNANDRYADNNGEAVFYADDWQCHFVRTMLDSV